MEQQNDITNHTTTSCASGRKNRKKTSVTSDERAIFLEQNGIPSDAGLHYEGMKKILTKLYVTQMLDKINWDSTDSYHSKLQYFYTLDTLNMFTQEQMHQTFRKKFLHEQKLN